jgi:hypothetical protein
MGKISIESFEPFIDDYLFLTFKEFETACAASYDRYFFVGCGSLPLTSIFYDFYRFLYRSNRFDIIKSEINFFGLNKRFSSKFKDLYGKYVEYTQERKTCLTLIDRSHDALDSASRILSGLGIADSIESYVLDIRNWTPSDKDNNFFLHIASMVSPREQILDSLFKNLKEKNITARILIRHASSSDLRSILYEDLPSTTIEKFVKVFGLELVGRFQPEPGSEIVTGFTVCDFNNKT